MDRLKEPKKIQNMFNEIAPQYDFMNNLISFGTHRLIKKLAIKKIQLPTNCTVLDLCCGTGDIAKILSGKKEVKKVVAVDFSSKMIEIAKKKNYHKKIEYIEADCTRLPFEKESFDFASMFFGLRNIENSETALSEIHRILKPEGQFMHLDFCKKNPFINLIFDFYTPILAKIFTKNKTAYEYLIKSKKEFFSESELEKKFGNAGFEIIKKYNFFVFPICSKVCKKSFVYCEE